MALIFSLSDDEQHARAQQAELLARVMDEELPRFAEALERLGK